MKSRIKAKTAFIVAVTLICIYGIIGFPRSRNELIANLHKNIRLGLDLSGGTQLVMEVELQDAFKAFADSAIDRLKEELKKDNIDFTSIDRNDPQTLQDAEKIEVDIKGVPFNESGTLRNIVNDLLFEWNLTVLNSTDFKNDH
jgi:preprotein translocase subunit SecD